jgi:hypothetical protein
MELLLTLDHLPFSSSSEMKNSTVVVAATVGVLAVAAIGYAVYFDSKRQTDPEFKRKLSTFFFILK